jgi:HEAT repeat protein
MRGLIGIVVCLLLGLLLSTGPASAQLAGSLIDQLHNSSPDARRAAAFKLGQNCANPSPQTVPALVKALDDPEGAVRATAAESLGALGQASQKAVPDLVAHAGDKDAEVRGAIALSLGRLNMRSDRVLETLTKLSGDQDPDVQRDATIAFALLGKMDSSTMPKVMEALREGKSRSVDAAQALCIRLGVASPKKVVPALIAGLQENREPMGSRILWALKTLGSQSAEGLPGVVEAYEKLGEKQRLTALTVVVKADKAGDYVPGLLQKALKQPSAEERRESLVIAMRYHPGWDKLVGPVIEAMKDPDPVIRYMAIRSARDFKDKTDALLSEILLRTQDQDARIRTAAVEMLGLIGKSRADILQVLEKAATGEELPLRFTAIKSLNNIGQTNPGAVIPVLERAGKNNTDDRAKKIIEMLVKKLEKLPPSKQSPESERETKTN